MVSILIVPILLTPLYLLFSYILLREFSFTTSLKIFLLGGLGWAVAFFLRLIPLQIFQLIFLIVLGTDLTDQNSITSFSSSFLVIIWSPIFASLFEEGGRYFFYLRNEFIKKNRIRGASVFGLGWASGEIVVIFSIVWVKALVFEETVNFTIIDLLPGFIERISATLFHVGASIIVIYAVFENPLSKKNSLWLAIILHMFLNFSTVIWILTFSGLSASKYIWSLEITLFIMATAVFSFAILNWSPTKETKMIE